MVIKNGPEGRRFHGQKVLIELEEDKKTEKPGNKEEVWKGNREIGEKGKRSLKTQRKSQRGVCDKNWGNETQPTTANQE